MKQLVVTLTAISLLSGCVIYVGDGHAGTLQHTERTLKLDSNGLQQLVANTGAGKLQLIGEEGRTNIEVNASIHYYSEEDIRLSLTGSGSQAELQAEFSNSFSMGNSPYMDLVVRVPSGLTLDLNDGSGATDISGLTGDITIEDGSGELSLSGGRNVRVTDGSGSLQISDISGNLSVEDGSGETLIRHVAGDVTVQDGSGELSVSNVGGAVSIEDGSGDINVDGAGALTILESGSGGVKTKNVKGNVDIR